MNVDVEVLDDVVAVIGVDVVLMIGADNMKMFYPIENKRKQCAAKKSKVRDVCCDLCWLDGLSSASARVLSEVNFIRRSQMW